MADPTTNDLPFLLEIQRRAAAGEQIDPARLEKVNARLEAYARQGIYKPNPGLTPSGLPIRAMNGNEATTLNELVDMFQRQRDLVTSFRKDYAGAPVLGRLENAAQSVYGGIGTPGQANWWRNFSEADSLERFKLFGASLTGNERQSWKATTVDPGVEDPQVMDKALTRYELARSKLARYVNTLTANGVAPDVIKATIGEDSLPEIQRPKSHTVKIGDREFTFSSPAGSTPEEVQAMTADELKRNGVNVNPNTVRVAPINTSAGAQPTPAEARDTVGGAIDAGVRGLADSLTLGADNKIVAGLNAVAPLDRLSGRNVKSIWDGASLGDAYQYNLRQENATDALDQQVNPIARLTGQITGGVLGFSKLKAAPTLLREGARNLGLGAVYGVNTASDTTDNANEIVVEGLKSGAASAIGGAIGQGVTKVGAKVLKGAQDETTQFLRSKGITLTPGQIMGGVAKNIEDGATGIPGVRTVINARRGDAFVDFNRAAMGEALAPIGAKAPDEVGEKGVLYMQEQVGKAYTNALGGVKLSVDDVYKAEMGQVLKAAQDLPADLRDQFTATMKNRVDKMFKRNKDGSVTLEGEKFQDVLQGLRKDVSALYKRGDVQADVFDGVASQAEDVLINLAKRQSPGTAEALDAANAAYRGKSIVQKAVLAGQNTDGVFTPAQLGRASTANTIKYGGENAAAAGQRPFFDLQRAAQNRLPNEVPDSGTFTRAAIGGAFGLGVPGGAAYAANEGLIDPQTALGIGALALPFTRTGSKVLGATLANRSPTLLKAGEAVANSSVPRAMGATSGALFAAPDYGVTVDPKTGVLYDANGNFVGVQR